MGWAARANVRSGNPKVKVSTFGAVIGVNAKRTATDGTRYRIGRDRRGASTGALLREPRKVRGKANVKAAKRRRTYVDGVRVIRIAA